MILTASQVVTPARILAPGWLLLDGDRIAGVGEGAPPRPADLDLGDASVVPGFVDLHVHGGGGATFDTGTADAAAVVAASHLAHGTTSMAASLVTDTRERMVAAIGELALLVQDGALAGVHLEGPWLSPQRSGAHQPGSLTHPDPASVDALLAAGDGAVRMVTLAPELPGGIDAVRRLVDAGVLAAIGHTDATYDEARAALDAGARLGTHLFNAMRPLHHRDPGAVGALLDSPVDVELVADGVHLHPAVLRTVFAAKPGRCILVTDAMAGPPRPTATTPSARWRSRCATASPGWPTARAPARSRARRSRWTRRCASPWPPRACRCSTSSTPRAPLPRGPGDLADVGALEAGRRADLVVLDDALAVVRVMRAGAWVDR